MGPRLQAHAPRVLRVMSPPSSVTALAEARFAAQQAAVNVVELAVPAALEARANAVWEMVSSTASLLLARTAPATHLHVLSRMPQPSSGPGLPGTLRSSSASLWMYAQPTSGASITATTPEPSSAQSHSASVPLLARHPRPQAHAKLGLRVMSPPSSGTALAEARFAAQKAAVNVVELAVPAALEARANAAWEMVSSTASLLLARTAPATHLHVLSRMPQPSSGPGLPGTLRSSSASLWMYAQPTSGVSITATTPELSSAQSHSASVPLLARHPRLRAHAKLGLRVTSPPSSGTVS